MIVKLSEVVKFYSGLIVSRERADLYKKAQYNALNYKSITENGNIDISKLDKLDLNNDINDKFITKENDVILKLAYPFKAVLIDKTEIGIVITSNFCKLICNDRILPEYLIACLNSEKIDRKLKIESKNQIISQISIKDLEKIEIEIYDMQKQKTIANLYNDYLKKIKLTNMILEKEKSIIKNIYK